jgi:ubiquitin carboxyl-terminal hydrolase 9/24
MDRLRVSHDNLTILNKYCKNATSGDKTKDDLENEDNKNDELRSNKEITLILRVMIVLREYLNEFDANYLYERLYPPLCRASKGKSIVIIVRFQVQNRQNEDIELLSHTNETIGSLRRQIFIK